MHHGGIEPPSSPWEGEIIPVDQWCFDQFYLKYENTDLNSDLYFMNS